MTDYFQIYPIGVIRRQGEKVLVEIHDPYKDALLGLDPFSHILLFLWFHKNDIPEKRDTLQVHPRGDRHLPLTGVFGTRSPQRPNPIALYVCRIRSIEKNIIHINDIDARDGSPVIDIKPYIPRMDSIPEARIAKWVK